MEEEDTVPVDQWFLTSLSFIMCNSRSPFLMVPYLLRSNSEGLFMSWSWDILQRHSMRSRQVSICTELKYSVTCCDQGSSEFGHVKLWNLGSAKACRNLKVLLESQISGIFLNLPVKRSLWFSRLFNERLTFMNWQPQVCSCNCYTFFLHKNFPCIHSRKTNKHNSLLFPWKPKSSFLARLTYWLILEQTLYFNLSLFSTCSFSRGLKKTFIKWWCICFSKDTSEN